MNYTELQSQYESFAKFLSLPTAETQTQVFGCFRFKYPLILPQYPLNPPRIPDNQASGPPFRRKQAHLARDLCKIPKGKNNVGMLRLPLFEMTNKMPSETRFPVSDGI
ncbi:hypothetical protein E0W35_03270 [Neisseria meningitidis]|nr:hypothetical protein [Neisseria meningitidis]MBG8845506.1 hypothetical protein [Neisseria meningitidis]MBJ7786179.1 hypothetical protein [Neisseria meningitidis]MBJ7853006.1 hypothetical protein [Neisseria meningitidis]